MPHVELKYSNDLTIKSTELFNAIEKVTNEMDSSAGMCKSRAYPTNTYLHTHVLLTMKVLQKPHRDKLFMQSLASKLEELLVAVLPQGCAYSVDLVFSNEYYVTSQVD